jgi:hypothetical protein
MRNYPDIGIQIGQTLLPREGIDLQKWSVIACDQFTSEPEYWHGVEHLVGDSPSTYNLILPEVYLNTPAEAARVQSTRQAMRSYLDQGLFVPYDGLILVERSVGGKTRHGLMLALDLECYNFNKSSQTLIRATEGTILDRLPPRMRIREGALLELPHILVLINDPARTVIEPLVAHRADLPRLYDTPLMASSGHVTGYAIHDPVDEASVVSALRALADPKAFRARYNAGKDQGVLLFAMGDGNHSLATARAIWEKIKPQVGMDHPARYALVEIENVHDKGLEFEPIHRVLFEVNEDPHQALERFYHGALSYSSAGSADEMIARVQAQPGTGQTVGMVSPQGVGTLSLLEPRSNLPVGTIQAFLDAWIKEGRAGKIDYVHGDEAVCHLGAQPGSLGFYLPAMDKNSLFKTVIVDGALPRKTFSLGEAREKRFYLEARLIAL